MHYYNYKFDLILRKIEDWRMQNKMEKKNNWVAAKVKCRGFYKENSNREKNNENNKKEMLNLHTHTTHTD